MKIKPQIKLKLKSNHSTIVPVDYSYEENVIPIKNPLFHAYYAYGPELERSMSRIQSYNFEMPFLNYNVRRTILDSGLTQYDLNLIHGPQPKFIVFGFTTLDRISGSTNLSLTRFLQNDLTKFDLVLNHESILGFPLTGIDKDAVAYYQQFLKQTFRFKNAYASSPVKFSEFIAYNFIVVANLENLKIFDGQLNLKLNFENAIDDKRVLLWMPVFEKKLIIDKNAQVTVE